MENDLNNNNLPEGLVHGDIFPDNTLFDDQGKKILKKKKINLKKIWSQ